MKLFKLAAILLALSGAALAQATLQCTSFPCQLQITAAQCGSFPCSLTITTTPLPPLAILPTAMTFAAPLNTDSTTQLVLVNNLSGSTLPLTWAVTGTDFADAKTGSCKNSQVTHGKCGIAIKYHPTTAAFPPTNATGTLTINGGTPNATVLVNLTGNTTQPPPPPASMTLTPATLDFGAPAVGAVSSIQLFTVKNTGTVDLTISSETGPLNDTGATTGFTYGGLGTCGNAAIKPSLGCTISVKYRPAALGVVSKALIVNTNAANSPASAVMTAGAVQAPGKSVLLTWVAPASDGAASYNLYRGGVKVGNVVGSVLTFTDTPVPSGTYTYTARTVDSSGRESIDSTSATVVIP